MTFADSSSHLFHISFILAAAVYMFCLAYKYSRKYSVVKGNLKIHPDIKSNILKSRGLFEETLAKAPIGIALLDADYRCFWNNDSLVEFLGASQKNLSGELLEDWIPLKYRKKFYSEIKKKTVKPFEIMFTNELWGIVTISTVRKNQKSLGYFIVQIADITDKHLMEEKLTHQAIHDSLTGLPNKLLFYDRLQHAIEKNKRKNQGLAVLFCDIDHFKDINDAMGHLVGDELLLIAADRIRNSLRTNDTVARFGGDEFVILIENLDFQEEALEIANKVIKEVKKPIALHDEEIFVTTSIGIFNVDQDTISADEVLKFADSAMYVAKEAGRDQIAIYDHKQEGVVLANLKIGNDLHRALKNKEFELLYQPIMDLKTGNITGVEALLYWNHPEKGVVGPSEFIHLAEETDLIIPIGNWVLEEAIRAKAEISKKLNLDLTMSVNLSFRQLANENTTNVILDFVKEYEINPNEILLEITESSFVQDSVHVRAVMEKLIRHNCKFAIDDFGTGYSSFNYLKRFSAEILKIDTSFTKHICDTSEDLAIVAAIINLGMALNMKIVAEGIETEEQLAQLLTLGCNYGQGYLFSRAISKQTLHEILATSSRNWKILEENVSNIDN